MSPQLDELLRRCSSGDSTRKDKGRANWDLCMLLFTAKTSTPPMYAALANQFDGKVAFGEVRRHPQVWPRPYPNPVPYPNLTAF